MIGNFQPNLRVTLVSIGHYTLRIDRMTGAFTTLLKDRVVDSIVCISIKRVQRYFASTWSVPSAAVENCTELATWRSCLVSPFFFAFQSVSLILVLFNLFLLVQIRIWKCKGNLLSICSFLPFLLLASFIFFLGIMGCGSPFCSLSYLHVPDKHQWFSLSIFNFIRNVTFNKSLISKCNIRLEINVIVALQFFAFEYNNWTHLYN